MSASNIRGHFPALAVAHNLDIADTARLFATLYTSAADAAIGCWDAKYHCSFWRPVTAIDNGDIDGNPDTIPDSAWNPLTARPIIRNILPSLLHGNAR
jgi:hypothetical protein